MKGQTSIIPPAVGDPVVHGGVKYRIRAIAGDQATVRVSFGTKVDWTTSVAALEWDPVPALWRAARLEVAGQIAAELDPYTAESLQRLAGDTLQDPGSAVAIVAPHELEGPVGDVSPPAPVAASGVTIATADPGHCAIHGDELVTAKQAGVRSYGWGAGARVYCPDRAGHDGAVDQARCWFCGGRLVPVGTYEYGFRDARRFCSTTHRNYNWRWLVRRARAKEATRRG